MESHPSPTLTDAGMGMTETVGEVWADNPPLKINEAIRNVPAILVFQFFISCFSGRTRPAPKTIFFAHQCSHKSRPRYSHRTSCGTTGYSLTLSQAVSS